MFDNTSRKLSHATALNEIWAGERERPNRWAIFSEFDFLPGPGFLSLPAGGDAVYAAEYCTRDPVSLEMRLHRIPGAWFVLIDKEWAPHLDFSPCGRFNDPANGLPASLIPSADCLPRHYGVRVGERGEHLFWSRHYNDPPGARVVGFNLDDIRQRIDRTLDDYENR